MRTTQEQDVIEILPACTASRTSSPTKAEDGLSWKARTAMMRTSRPSSQLVT